MHGMTPLPPPEQSTEPHRYVPPMGRTEGPCEARIEGNRRLCGLPATTGPHLRWVAAEGAARQEEPAMSSALAAECADLKVQVQELKERNQYLTDLRDQLQTMHGEAVAVAVKRDLTLADMEHERQQLAATVEAQLKELARLRAKPFARFMRALEMERVERDVVDAALVADDRLATLAQMSVKGHVATSGELGEAIAPLAEAIDDLRKVRARRAAR